MGDTVIVKIEQGDLRGKILSTKDDVQYYSFQGIPYAKPPVGSLRFKAPVPPEPWTGVRDALSLGNIAPQLDMFKQKLAGNEDCLFLNVYTPQLSPSSLIPVMVWIHGGAFVFGSGNTDIYGPQPLMREGILLVTLNYRLGVLGFFNVPGTDVSPNNGLKDQNAALRWIQKNINKFGGDPNNVTIFGESAGGFSVHHHILSPLSKGLFHKAIAMSGSALCTMALPPVNTQKIFVFGKEVGYNGDNPQELVEFAMNLPAEAIAAASARTLEDMRNFMGPVVEEAGPGAFIVEEPLKRIRSGNFNRVPIMAGVTSSEGKLYFLMPMQAVPLTSFNENLDKLLPENLELEPGSEKAKNIAKKVKKFYFGERDISFETREQFIKFLGDSMLVYGVYEMMREHANVNTPIFYYQFSYEGDYGFVALANTTAPGPGANHGDDVFYLFQSEVVPNVYSPGTPEHEVSRSITKLWTNFAKTGNPSMDLNIKWIPATEEDKWYLDINTKLSLQKDLFKERMELWEEIYREVFGDR